LLPEPIHILELQVRVTNTLENMDGVKNKLNNVIQIHTIEDLLKTPAQEIEAMANVGESTMTQIYTALAKLGIICEGHKPTEEEKLNERRQRSRQELLESFGFKQQ
jgi:DNA-directed RNA polymerase alpha subunit